MPLQYVAVVSIWQLCSLPLLRYPFSASSPVSPFGSCLLGDMVTCELSLLCNAKRAWRPCALSALLAVTDTVAALVLFSISFEGTVVGANCVE
jgi:hypothetical protein